MWFVPGQAGTVCHAVSSESETMLRVSELKLKKNRFIASFLSGMQPKPFHHEGTKARRKTKD
jgi:hypothetical protein